MNATNGAAPRRRGPALSRRARLLVGGTTAVVIAAVLVAPVVLLTGKGAKPAKSCAPGLAYKGREYVARRVAPARFVQGVAIGVGVAGGCGAPAANVDIRSLLGIAPAAAVGLPTDDTSIYVRRGLCTRSARRALLACVGRRH